MTIIQMHTAIDDQMDKAGAPWMNSTEKDYFLNLAQLEFTKERYAEFEQSEKRRQDLVSLVRKKSFTVLTIDLSSVNVPSFMYILALSASSKDECGNTVTSPVKPMQWDDYIESERDPFNKSDVENPIYLTSNNGTVSQIEIKGITNLISADLVYLKIPVTMLNDDVTPANNVNCELPESTHEEVVNLAVRKILGVVKDPNYQIQLNEILNQESIKKP